MRVSKRRAVSRPAWRSCTPAWVDWATRPSFRSPSAAIPITACRSGLIIRQPRAWPPRTQAGPCRLMAISRWALVHCARSPASSRSCSISSVTRSRREGACSVSKDDLFPPRAFGGGVSERAGLPRDALTFIVAPTASIAGSVQISARVVEIGLHKMDSLGFDVRLVTHAIGSAPIPPIAKNDLRGIGRTNDCLLYGGQVRYTIRTDDDTLEELATNVPASSSIDYGTGFYEIFQRYDTDFYKIDKMLFSPAEIWLTSATTGRTFHGGRVDAAR